MAKSKRKSKLHPIVAAMGYSNEADFYADFPTQESYEMAMGGFFQGGGPLTPVDRPGFSGIYNAPDSTPSDVSFALPENLGTPMVIPRDREGIIPTTSDTTGYHYQWQDPSIQQKMAVRRGFSTAADWFASGKDKNITGKMMAYNANPSSLKSGGSVFPQIQSADGFFSMAYENVPAPYQNGSFQMGGQDGNPYYTPGATHPTDSRFIHSTTPGSTRWVTKEGETPFQKLLKTPKAFSNENWTPADTLIQNDPRAFDIDETKKQNDIRWWGRSIMRDPSEGDRIDAFEKTYGNLQSLLTDKPDAIDRAYYDKVHDTYNRKPVSPEDEKKFRYYSKAKKTGGSFQTGGGNTVFQQYLKEFRFASPQDTLTTSDPRGRWFNAGFVPNSEAIRQNEALKRAFDLTYGKTGPSSTVPEKQARIKQSPAIVKKYTKWMQNPDRNYWLQIQKLGGYAGFGEGHPFPYQPRMPKNGAEAYGRPTYGARWIAQDGGTKKYRTNLPYNMQSEDYDNWVSGPAFINPTNPSGPLRLPPQVDRASNKTPFQEYLQNNRTAVASDTIPNNIYFAPKDSSLNDELEYAVRKTYGRGYPYMGGYEEQAALYRNPLENFWGRDSWLMHNDKSTFPLVNRELYDLHKPTKGQRFIDDKSKKKLGGYAGFGEGHPYMTIHQYGGNRLQYDLTSQDKTFVATPPMTEDIPHYINGEKLTDKEYQKAVKNWEEDIKKQGWSIGLRPHMEIQLNIRDKKKLGGTPCYKCGGSHMKEGGLPDINQGPQYFTNKMNDFTDHLRNTALIATEDEMNNQFMAYGGTGYTEEFPYAMPYEYKKGGHWIQKAVNPKHKGYCTPMSKPTCTPRRKALARTFKKYHGFHKKQDGGEQQVMEIIQAYAQKIGASPEVILERLKALPEDQQQAALQQITQEIQGEPESMDFAYGGVPMAQFGEVMGITVQNPDGTYSSVNPNLVTGLTQSQSTTSPTYRRDIYNYGMFPANYGYWSPPSVKLKGFRNSTWNLPGMAGMPGPQSLPLGPSTDPNFAQQLRNAGVSKYKQAYSPFTGLPTKTKYKFDYYQNPKTGEIVPTDQFEGKKGSWLGNTFRKAGSNLEKYGVLFPSKKNKADYENELRRSQTPSPETSSVDTQAAADALFARDQAMRSSPSWQDQVQDKALIPWLEQTAGRLGTTPDQLVNPTPQVGPPQVESMSTSPEATWEQLNQNYLNSVAERDALFKEHGLNKRGRPRNILGIRYQDGGVADGVYDLTDEEIQILRNGGYDIEYI